MGQCLPCLCPYRPLSVISMPALLPCSASAKENYITVQHTRQVDHEHCASGAVHIYGAMRRWSRSSFTCV